MGTSILEVLSTTSYETHVIASQSLISEISPLNNSKVIVHDLDLFEIDSTIELFKQMSAIIHAGMPGLFETAHKESLFKKSKSLTEHIVNIALFAQVKKMIYLSSASILKSSPNKDIIDENSDFNSKQLNTCLNNIFLEEQEVWRAWAEGMNVVILHSGIALGKLSEGSVLYNISQWRNLDASVKMGSNGFIQINELAESVVESLDERHDNRRYICITENLSYRNFFEVIGKNYENHKLKRSIKNIPSSHFYRLKKLFGISTNEDIHEQFNLIKAEFEYSNHEFLKNFKLNNAKS